MSSYIGWPANVNKIISDQTSITIGDGGYVEDSTGTGHKERYLTSLITPRKYQVTQFFNYSEKDENGMSEYDRFEAWYLFKHKRGTVPFEFPSISKFNIDSAETVDNYSAYPYCRYKITSSLAVSKSGLDMQVVSTWEEEFSGILNLNVDTNPYMTAIKASKGIVEIILSDNLVTEPPFSDYSFKISSDGKTYQDYTPWTMLSDKNTLIYKFEYIPTTKRTYYVSATSGSITKYTTFEV